MSLTLRLLADRYAFESSPTRHDLGALHVPFDELTQTARTEARLGGGISLGWMRVEVARQVTHQTELETRSSFMDKTDAIAQVLEIIADEHLQPALVFDDTDRWLSEESARVVEGFFGEGVRWMLELPAALIVAVHPHYFRTIPQDELLQYLDTRITIPRLENVAAIDAILRRRIEQYADIADPDLSNVLDPEASSAILDVYMESGSLRRALQVCHIALHDAMSDIVPRITARHIRAASNAG